MKKILISADAYETKAALIEDDRVVETYIEREELALPKTFDTTVASGGGFSDGTASTGDLQLLQMKLRTLEQQISTLELDVKERDEKIEELRLGGVVAMNAPGPNGRTASSSGASAATPTSASSSSVAFAAISGRTAATAGTKTVLHFGQMIGSL